MRSVFVLLLLGLAGCADAPADAPVGQPESAASLHGHVVDQTVAPIAGAIVDLIRGSDVIATETTNDKGRFGFDTLEPGTYVVRATAEGHAPVSSLVDVLGATRATLQTPALPSDAGHRVVSQVAGYFQCAAGAVGLLVNACYMVDRYSGQDIMADASAAWLYDELLAQQEAPDFVQAETYWRSTQPLSDRLFLRWDVQDPESRFAKCSDTAEGTSPLIHTLYRKAIAQCHLGPADATPLGLQVEFFPGRHDLIPAGAVLEQETETLFTAFYGHVPPVGWTLAEHG